MTEAAAPKTASKPEAAPQAESPLDAALKVAAKPQAPEAVQALWKKAQAAKGAAEGILDTEIAAALWAEAEAASKPSPEAIKKAEDAKAVKAKAEKKKNAAKAAFEAGLIEEAVCKKAEAEAEKARIAYKEAAAAAKGFGPGSGGRCKGQMSGLDAAVKVLSESKEPMQVGKICEAALKQGLWTPEGQTPAATLGAGRSSRKRMQPNPSATNTTETRLTTTSSKPASAATV